MKKTIPTKAKPILSSIQEPTSRRRLFVRHSRPTNHIPSLIPQSTIDMYMLWKKATKATQELYMMLKKAQQCKRKWHISLESDWPASQDACPVSFELLYTPPRWCKGEQCTRKQVNAQVGPKIKRCIIQISWGASDFISFQRTQRDF